MNKLMLGCRLGSFLILISFLVYAWKMADGMIQVIDQWWSISIGWSVFYIIIVSLFLFFNVAAAYGLFYTKKWGFLVAYLAIIFSTFFFSCPYVPFITKWINHIFFIRHASATLIIINLAVIFYIGCLHYFYRQVKK